MALEARHPQAAVRGRGERPDAVVHQPGHVAAVEDGELEAVEADQAVGSTDPEVTVAGLCDSVQEVGRQPVVDGEHLERVLPEPRGRCGLRALGERSSGRNGDQEKQKRADHHERG